MLKRWIIALGIAVVLVVGAAGCAAGQGAAGPVEVRMNSQQEGIWVNGEGKVTAVPDIATINLGISAQAASVAEAQKQASDTMNKIMKSLADNGVAQKDIKTQQFSITRVTRFDKDTQQEVVIGYRVDNTVNVKIRDISKAGVTIDAVAVAGGDLTRINGISFSVDDPTIYQNEARQKAMNDAKAKAEQIAKLAGVGLDKPTYINESVYIPGPIFREAMAKDAAGAASAPTPISPGEQEIRVNVQVVYSIK
jgi:uncharacterized protein YggE